IEVLWAYIQGDHEPLRTEAVRTLALSPCEDRFTWLAKLAGDETLGEATRADAVVGLAAQAEQFRPLLERLATSGVPTVADEAARILRLANHTASPPQFLPEATDIDAWLALTDGVGDAEA